jgi:hypothetical protein
MNRRRATIVRVGACAVSDLAAVPLLLGADDIPAAVGGLVALLGMVTAAAAIGIARRHTWSRHLAVTTRIIDLVFAVPAFTAGAGAGPVAAAAVTVALSVSAIGLLWRLAPVPALMPGLRTRS